MSGPGVALATVVMAAALALGAPARAADAPRRKVAVLEHRTAVDRQQDLADRLASRLKQTAALTIIDPAEARRRVAGVDAQVARCAGEAPCVSQIGAALGVDEVLLVGVSQLGDVVVALQRVDASAKTVGRLAETLAPTEEVDDARLLDWLHRLYPPEAFRRFGFILVTANIDGATVTLNGQEKGQTPMDAPLKVPAPRPYRVGVTLDGYQPFGARIDVLPDATVEVRAELSTLAGPVPWYKRWYLWAIVGGVVAASGVGVGLWAAYRTDDTNVRALIQW